MRGVNVRPSRAVSPIALAHVFAACCRGCPARRRPRRAETIARQRPAPLTTTSARMPTGHRPRLLFRRRRAPLYDVPARQEHRDHRVRLRAVDRKASTAPRANTASTSRSSTSRVPIRRRCTTRRHRSRPSKRCAACRTTGSPAMVESRMADRRIGRGLQGAHVAKPYDEVQASAIAGDHRTIMAMRRRHGPRRPPAAPKKRQTLSEVVRDRDAPRPCAIPRASPPSSATAARSRARSPASASARSSSRWRRRSRSAIAERATADRRSRHRHRQDVRVSRAGAALRRQGDRLHGHQDAAGPALPARPAAGARRARDCRSRSRCSRDAPTTSATTISSATSARRTAAVARRRAAPAQDHRLRARNARPATAASSPTSPRTRRSGRS